MTDKNYRNRIYTTELYHIGIMCELGKVLENLETSSSKPHPQFTHFLTE